MRATNKPLIGFREYILRRRITDSKQGDFVASAKDDPNLPDARNWKELELYFYTHHIMFADGMLTAAKLVWQQYRRLYPAYLFGKQSGQLILGKFRAAKIAALFLSRRTLVMTFGNAMN